MNQKTWNALAFWAFALMMFICTLVAVRWTIDFVTWTSLDSGWAQVLGSLAALAVAIFVMSQQNKNAVKLIGDADRVATLRRAKSVHTVLSRSRQQLNNIRVFTLTPPTDAAHMALLRNRFQAAAEILADMRTLLSTIPIYDRGSFDMAEGVHQYTEMVPNYLNAITALHLHPEDAGAKHVVDADKVFHGVFDEALGKFERGMNALKSPD